MLLVVGASGKLGGAITQRLLASGQAVRCTGYLEYPF